MFCKNCGKKIKEGDSFCVCCGTPVKARGGTMQIQEAEPNIESANKKKKIVIISCIVVMLVLAAAGTGALLYFNSDGYRSRKNMTLAEEAQKVSVNADVSDMENDEETVQPKETAQEETDASQQDKKEESDREDGMSSVEEYSDMETDVWKTEEHYRHTQDGGEYLQSLIEYDSREHIVRECFYNEDGSIFSETKWDNRYNGEGKLLGRTGISGSTSSIEEYDEEERKITTRCYDEWDRLISECPVSYEYDELEKVWYCDYMWLNYNEEGEYTGSGLSNHEIISYDEQGRITAFCQYPFTARCHMYDKTEEEIRQELAGISQESEKLIYREFAQMMEEYGDDGLIEVYRYDGEGNLQDVGNYHAADDSLIRKVSCTYEYDSAGNIRTSRMESESETVAVVYNRTVLQNTCGIQEVTWRDGEYGIEKPVLRFQLENGSVIEREATYDGWVDHVEYRDINGDGFREAFVYIVMPNNFFDTYYRIAVYQVQEGSVTDISPYTEFLEEASYWNTEIVEESETGYGVVLQLESYEKILGVEESSIYVADRLTIGYRDGRWEELSRESNPDGIGGAE